MQQTGLADTLEQYIGGLTVNQGARAGEPMTVLPWQSRFLKGAFREGVTDAALTVGRSNGKSALIGALAAACVDVGGPLVADNACCVVVASSLNQSKIIFNYVKGYLAPTFERYGVGGKGRFRINDSANNAMITDKETGASVRCFASDPRRLHGHPYVLFIGDEMAQWAPGVIDEILAAAETGGAKIPNSRRIWIGTRPDSDDHAFEKFLQGGVDYCQVHAPSKEADPHSIKTWRKANPSLDFMPQLKADVKKRSNRAKSDPERLAMFRSLNLNMGVSDTVQANVLTPAQWETVLERGPGERVGPVVLAVDTGENAAMTAAAAYWVASGRLECFGVFPATPTTLADRGRNDGVGPRLYERMAERGELMAFGDEVSDIGEMLYHAVELWGRPQLILCDTWKLPRVKLELKELGMSGIPLELRRQGFRDGSEDLAGFREAALTGWVSPVDSLLLTSAMNSGRVVYDPAGNGKLAKATQGGRRTNSKDDALAASILAVSAGYRRRNKSSVKKARAGAEVAAAEVAGTPAG